jgi:hypothetical protein
VVAGDARDARWGPAWVTGAPIFEDVALQTETDGLAQ